MSCTYTEDISAYVDGQLAANRAEPLRRHLPQCASCRALEEEVRATLTALAAIPAPEPPLDLRRRVLTSLPASPARQSWLLALLRAPYAWPSVALAGVAMVALVVTTLAPPAPTFDDPEGLYVAQNLELLSDYEAVGLEFPEDLEVVAALHELGEPKEATP